MNDFENILSCVKNSDCSELTKLVQAILARYDVLFPEEEVFFLSLPKYDKGEREAILAQFVETISRQQ